MLLIRDYVLIKASEEDALHPISAKAERYS
jgi:hypothetical protein